MWCIFSLPWKQYINIIKHVKLIKMNYMWPSDSWWYKLLYYWNKDACVQQWLTNLFYISCLLLGPWKGKFRYLILGHFRLWYLIKPKRNFDTYRKIWTLNIGYCQRSMKSRLHIPLILPISRLWYLIPFDIGPPFQGLITEVIRMKTLTFLPPFG